MDLSELKAAVPGLGGQSHNEKIKLFGWWLHVHKNKPAFSGADLGKCYDDLAFPRPSSFGPYFATLTDKKELIKKADGYRLAHQIKDALDTAHGQTEAVVKVKAILSDLATRLPTLAEQDYYKETLICYHHAAFRAAVVMTWNIAFSHLCGHVLASRFADFNAQWLMTYPGMHKPNKPKTIVVYDDFGQKLKESETIAICRDAGIITTNIYNIMDGALKRRNAAAHPSTVIITQTQADAYIEDLILNVVLKI